MTYLDTHVVVWLYAGRTKRLSQTAAKEIDRASSLLISPAVELELDYLHRRQRVGVPAAEILDDLRARIGLRICDIPFPLVTREALSVGWTEDVFDRLIVSQAAATVSPLITADTRIIEHYAHAIW